MYELACRAKFCWRIEVNHTILVDPSSASALEPSSTSAYIFFKISSTSTALILINNVCSKILGPCANTHFHLNSNYEPCFLIQDLFLFIAAAFFALLSSLRCLSSSFWTITFSFSLRFNSFCSSFLLFCTFFRVLFSSLFLFSYFSASRRFFCSFSITIAHASELVKTRACPVLVFLLGSRVVGSWRYSVYGEQRDELETDVNEGYIHLYLM